MLTRGPRAYNSTKRQPQIEMWGGLPTCAPMANRRKLGRVANPLQYVLLPHNRLTIQRQNLLSGLRLAIVLRIGKG
jgi:hypothetical protein